MTRRILKKRLHRLAAIWPPAVGLHVVKLGVTWRLAMRGFTLPRLRHLTFAARWVRNPAWAGNHPAPPEEGSSSCPLQRRRKT